MIFDRTPSIKISKEEASKRIIELKTF